MTNRFLISVAAAALIAGTGFANAQGPGGMSRESGSGSTMQHSAPSGGGAAQQHRDAAEPKASQSEKAPGAGMKAEGREGKSGTVGQAPDKSGAKTTQGREDHMNAQGREGKEGKSGTVGQSPDKSGTTTTQGREDRMNAPGQKGSTTEMNRTQSNQGTQSTTGNAATSAVAAPPPEKRTQIVSAIKSERIEDVTNVNVNVVVGTRLPDTVHFYPLPPRIVEIYPQWRGYEVIRIHGRYVIVRPATREIVYVIEG